MNQGPKHRRSNLHFNVLWKVIPFLSIGAAPCVVWAQSVPSEGELSNIPGHISPGTDSSSVASTSASNTAAQEAFLAGQFRQLMGTMALPDDPVAESRALTAAKSLLAATMTSISRPQTLIVVDRSPLVQRLWVAVASPDGSPWSAIGAVRVSTGKPGQKEHFKTPVGVFVNTPAILGYRAQGTRNEHGIRGIGQKGMRVWDFGWQTTEDWRKRGAVASVRLEMHATDPTFLEGRLGKADSEACIRIPSRFNLFLDRFGLIDAQLTALAPASRAVTALLLKDAMPSPLAGDKVVVVDTSEPRATISNPVLAAEIQRRFADWLAAQTPPSITQAGQTSGTGTTGQALSTPAASALLKPIYEIR